MKFDIDVYPGSFDPFHRGHQELWEAIDSNVKVFEISKNRRNKGTLDDYELAKRVVNLEQYGKVVVTDAVYFHEKIKYFSEYRSVTFHVGIDTAIRVLQDHSIEEIESWNCSFCVYNRLLQEFSDLEVVPKNFYEGKSLTTNFTSSTAIRNKYEARAQTI